MLELKNVKKKYRTKAGDVNALDGITLTLPSKGLIFITGKSGCGKTTLLNVIGGLDSPDSGDIIVWDKRFSAFSPEEYDSYRNTFVGFVFQEYNLLKEYTVEGNIKMAMELQGSAADNEEFERLLRDMDINELKDRFPAELSGGQRQRVAIARALVKDPRIIMADEPTGALDSAIGAQVLDTLKKLAEEKLVIVVSHDREFAEKYADRIIHLVDGRIASDVSFTERKIDANVSEQDGSLVVRDGSTLSEKEKDILAKAISERKRVEVVDKLYYRDKAPTGKLEKQETEPVALKKSKMKLKSAVSLGVKSLGVKPLRLIVTVLISALAFAVFGIFDSVANFSTQRVLKNVLTSSASDTMVAYADYVVSYDENDRYSLKLSSELVEKLENETRGSVKGISGFRKNNSTFDETHSRVIDELSYSSVVLGSKYYSDSVNGFIEFGEDDIDSDGAFKSFSYKLICGTYPEPVYNNNALDESRLQNIAISSYLAESIIFYLNGKPLNEIELTSIEDLVGASITIDDQAYTITGIIDCGDIPEKYSGLKTTSPYSVKKSTLIDDFAAYIDSSAHKCVFVGDGYVEGCNLKYKSAKTYSTGNFYWNFTLGDSTVTKSINDYVFAAHDYDYDNVALFSGRYPSSASKIKLGDDEVLVSYRNFTDLFKNELDELSVIDKANIKAKLAELESIDVSARKDVIADALELMEIAPNDSAVPVTVKQTYTKTGAKVTKELKVVGVYFGVNGTPQSSTSYTFMMSDALMDELNIFSEQGDFLKLLFSSKSIDSGAGAIVKYLTSEKGFSLNWYNNSALSIIRENETVIKQFADLFLYAAIALALFSMFMLYNYISTSISGKTQSVGVLRALGACGKDILLTFLSESLIIALINGVLANVLAVIGCAIVNSYIVNVMNISVHFALFGLRQILVICAISLLTAIASSALPIAKITKKKPVELIRRP